MAQYNITINERTNEGKALLAYLTQLGIIKAKNLSGLQKRKTGLDRSLDDVKAGRVMKIKDANEMMKRIYEE